MASRAGQKGTIGLIIPESDMPFTKDGIRPDIIVNPHAIPTRMTIGQLVETITGKACAIYGGYGDCTAFINKGSKVGVFGDMLAREGYHSSGNEILYNGMTGEQIDAEIFIGPNYYMRLKHMVKDKINYRALGPRTALTRQPVSGRANDGGLRIGEMERDAVISHGAAEFLRESMMERGDKYSVAVCNNTGMVAIYNPSKNLFMSPMADGPLRFVASLDGKDMNIENITKFGRNFSIIDVPYSLKLLIQELQTCNIQMRLITEDNIKQMENLSFSKNIDMLLFKKDVTPKSIVDEIKKTLSDISREDMSKLNTPESPKSPEIGFPEDLSPAYVPTDEEYAEIEKIRQMMKESGEPMSPEYNPYDDESLPESPENIIYSPHSPTESPPENIIYSPHSPVDSPPFNVLSQQANEYSINERVHYRGDIHPERFWVIKNIGDTFITIETDKYDEYDDTETIQVVTALDIYRHGDLPHNSPYLDPLTPVAELEGGGGFHRPNMSNIGVGTVPAINFAPVFKIMNGGNDFSTDPIGQEPVQQFGEQLNTTGLIQTPMTEVDKPIANKDSPEKVDFSKLLIKKV